MTENGRGGRLGVGDGATVSHQSKASGVRTALERSPERTTERPVERTERQTLSSRFVKLMDVPVLLEETLTLDEADELFLRLVSVVDGESTIAALADRIGIDREQARACFAILGNQGAVAFERRAHTDSGDLGPDEHTPRKPEFWLADLRPRRK